VSTEDHAGGPEAPLGSHEEAARAGAEHEEAARAGAEAGAVSGAGAAHAKSARELYMTEGARRAAHRLSWSLVVLFVFVIGITAASLVFSVNQSNLNRCQRVVNTRFQQADISRARAAQASGEAQIELWNALLALRGNQAQQRAEFIQAFSRYKDKVRKVTAITFPAKTGTEACSG
jgi:hypothetical protein